VLQLNYEPKKRDVSRSCLSKPRAGGPRVRQIERLETDTSRTGETWSRAYARFRVQDQDVNRDIATYKGTCFLLRKMLIGRLVTKGASVRGRMDDHPYCKGSADRSSGGEKPRRGENHVWRDEASC